ncbi:alpha/beta hydrolase [Aquimarina algiphila]|uniref:alpha/beta hydrolase n=1 Tax=Aquimarina algiphila TaxID=2047982 RepID=UPI0023304BBA|nr:alpha/beta hydrolase-fold protein [Aquimarina algiphila]
MNKHIIIVFVIFLTSCGIPQSEFDLVKNENNALKKRIDSIEHQLNTLEYLVDNSEVVLANTKVKELTSTYNGQSYKIKIKFPKGYENGSEKYPVLYVLDAETNFGGVSYIVQRLIKDKLIPKVLIVGIAYGTDYDDFYKLRSRDLTPVEDKNLRIGGKQYVDPTGGAPEFTNFLESELFPFIAKNYRVKEEERAIYGHSYGGLYGCYVMLKKPHLFNKYLLLSPSLWFKDNLLIKEAKETELNLKPTKLYMASGMLETRIQNLQMDFVFTLNSKRQKNLELKVDVMRNETHRTVFGPGFTNGLRYLYSEKKKQ